MITLSEAQRATGGQWLAQPLPADMPLQGGCFDTRAIDGKQVFFALQGEQADGHDYLPRLAGTAVRLAVVSREVSIPGYDGAVLRVHDVLAALAALAGFVVRKHAPKVVALTGSYGKTTTKEVVAHVLEGALRVLKTPGSLNNEIGVPIALLDLDGSHDVAVLEFSARKPGDIDYLGRIAPPHIAVLLAVGHAHIGVFGSREAIYRTKGEIFQRLRSGGLAIVNGDDPRLAELAAGQRLVSFGRDDGTYYAEQVRFDALGRQHFTARCADGHLDCHAGSPGPHGLFPILVAWAVARELGLPDALVAGRCGVHPAQKGRAMPIPGPGGAVLIDDTYNASPETVVNLIGTLAAIEATERILVLGHLSELEAGLGDSVPHIAQALTAPLTDVWVHAPHMPDFARQLAAAAGSSVPVHVEPDLARLIATLRARDRQGVVMGFKGARSAHLERAVQGLLGVAVTCRLPSCGLLMACSSCQQLTAP